MPAGFTAKEIRNMPTIRVGQMDNLKYETGTTRIWVSRMTVEDGAKRNEEITVELYKDGRWVSGN